MFTGLIRTTARLLAFEPGPKAWWLEVETRDALEELRLGASVAVNGVCLTLSAWDPRMHRRLAFEVLEETKRCTQFEELEPGACLNIEPSLRVGDTLDGHFVSGHIDGVGHVEEIKRVGQDTYMRVSLDHPRNACYLTPKGSIALNGVSLTVVDLLPDSFAVWLIPHTLEVTHLGALHKGAAVNLEYDLLAKYAVQSYPQRLQASG